MTYNNPYVYNRPYEVRGPQLYDLSTNLDIPSTVKPIESKAYDGTQELYTSPNTDSGGNVNTGAYIQAGTALLGSASSALASAKQGLNLPQLGDGYNTSATGQPVYTGGRDIQTISGIKPQGATFEEVGSQALSLAATGASVGGVPGAIVGGAVGAGMALLSGNARKNKQEDELNKARTKIKKGQIAYNRASQAFDQQQASMNDYRRRRDMTNRLYNLYSTPQQRAY